MPRRALAASTVALSLLTLAACGSDSGEEGGSGAGIESVSISADSGKAPKVEWEGQLDPDEVETEVLVDGEGDETKTGDSVLAHIWIGNGYDEKEVYNSYEMEQPQVISLNDTLLPGLQAGLLGQKVGSTVAVAASAEDAYGEGGNPQLGIGNKDSVLFVTELLSKVPTGPQGEEREPAKWAPAIVEEGGKVTGFDFEGTPENNGKLWVTKTVKGDGPVVEKGQTIYVNYLGQVYGGDEPFDESYSRGEPTSFEIGVGAVVDGWDQSLVGETVGSRVVVAIPPALGYGKKGNPDAGIKGTDTLYFVVDILAAV
ncbi:FKBP-type peptidyl-prolyl cis-trans isomerase [Nocardioides solisilvae]|uniref:FKBP-type peptidyl-prolyl cis-trans isomerase n=1 Tax=Nocardioides solisilvae TaxID=1542435 RepID=UPI0013A5AFCB|nr:FKBP-type peptidyl-prolyl cis-trans isomerase [Nocardioides solisilvae]